MTAGRPVSPATSPPASPIEFGAFRALLATWLERDLTSWSAESLLNDDLEFDSLTMAEVCVFFADEGIHLPEDLVTELRTLADLHHYFVVLGPRRLEPGGRRTERPAVPPAVPRAEPPTGPGAGMATEPSSGRASPAVAP